MPSQTEHTPGKGLFALSGWARVRIVISVVWIIVVGLTRSGRITGEAERQASLSYHICTASEEANYPNSKFKRCAADYKKTFDLYADYPLADPAITAIGTLLCFWGILYTARRVVSWVRVGFR